MALTSAEKQRAYRDRERVKLEALRQAANGGVGNVTDDPGGAARIAALEAEIAALKAKPNHFRHEAPAEEDPAKAHLPFGGDIVKRAMRRLAEFIGGYEKEMTKPQKREFYAKIADRFNVRADRNGGEPADAAELQQARARIAALEAEVAALKAKLASEPKVEADSAVVAELKRELEGVKAELKERTLQMMAQAQSFRDQLARRAAKPKVEKPPLPPDEEREKQIEMWKTKWRNLNARFRAFTLYHAEAMKETGAMPFETMSALAKVVHPDRQPTEEERAAACRLFTSWKADNGKARRKAR